MKQKVRIVLRGKHPNDDLDQFYQYICYLFKNHDQLDEDERVEVNYRNYL